ncbi:putative exo-beta-glucanase exg0 [Phaeomoniella chlamydospora]|uniref:Putative exo-beta-glucanase exg0 n=1 Tax=Phaeomoniella chlamydospora TaxID=158046 RepID=A0A0G2H586_PHACM|nr:putative exo-beta-glucanase exg0 [Phaeomoniella chlamydospora]
MDYGATGDGTTDDTDAINSAISDGGRCGLGCDSSTVTPAIVYFPPGTYLVSTPIIQYYYTQFIGDAINVPTIKAAASFSGMAVIDADPYEDSGANWYTNQNNFFRQIRNFIIDLKSMPMSSGAGIHWQVAQATSLQNIVFNMVQGGGDSNKQQGIFMDNGSGGFMTDLTFNGGNYGAFLGSQQFTTRNLTFNNCNTALYMNWNWAWTFKSLSINDCSVGINMSAGGNNQTVGSVLVLDSKFTGTSIGIITSRNADSIPESGGTLIVKNVDFSGATTAIAGLDGSSILAGGSTVASWGQGSTYSGTVTSKLKRDFHARQVTQADSCGAASAASVAADSSVTSVVASSAPQSSASTANAEIAGTATTIQGTSSAVAADSSSESTATVEGTDTTATTAAGGSVVASVATASASYVAASSASSTDSASTGSSASTSSSGNSTCSVASTPVSKAKVQATLDAPTLPSVLLDGDAVFERAKPQYESYSSSSFVSVKAAGAKGDGTTDDTAAIQNVLNNATSDQIVYFDHGAYIITSTVKVPKDIKIVGEIWPLIMASGTYFSDQSNPKPVFQVGQSGDTGSVEISDLMFETAGPAPGAILMQWNVAEESQGSAGMWDVHFRIGGSAGTQLQSDTCSKDPNVTTTASSDCMGAYLLFHVTSQASGYFENNWYWVADHELDLDDHNQINIWNGRGVLIESHGPVWLYGTSAEHSQLYNYQISGAQNVFMALIQTETPYMQSNPDALNGGFTPNTTINDPTFSDCTTESCKKAWGLRVTQSSDVYMYGGGLYSFFDNYDQTCLQGNNESCQENMVDVECSDSVYLYGLSTKASVNMVTLNGESAVLGADNDDTFCQTVALFEQ